MFESVGIAADLTHRSQMTSRAIARPAGGSVVSTAMRESLEEARIVELRWSPGDPDLACNLSDMVVPDWTATSLGRLWLESGVEHVLAGVTSLNGKDRSLMVLLGSLDRAVSEAPMATCLLSLGVEMLRDHAARAFGSTTPTRWLTDREHEVLDQLTLGKSVRQIAEELGRSPHTVHDHVKALHRKLHASSRGELVAMALGHAPPTASENLGVAGQLTPETKPETRPETRPESKPVANHRLTGSGG